MADILARMVVRKGTAAAWASANPVLLAGEIGYETDTKNLRVGDGVTVFTALPIYRYLPNPVGNAGRFVRVNGAGTEFSAAALPSIEAIAALTPAADRLPYYSGTDTAALAVLTDAGRALLDDVDNAAQRVTLGLGALATAADVGTAQINASAYASQAEAEAGSDNTKLMTPLRVAQAARPKFGTSVATTSGTSIDFTGIPSTARRVRVLLVGVSTNGTSQPMIQIGDSGGVETTGYVGNGGYFVSGTASSATANSSGFVLSGAWGAGNAAYMEVTLTKPDAASNQWLAAFCGTLTGGVASGSAGGGAKTLSDTLDRIRLTTVGGTDTFDAGTVNISWE